MANNPTPFAQPPKPAPHSTDAPKAAAQPTNGTLDFDATISAIQDIIPQLLQLLEMVRAMGHALPPAPPTPPA